MDEGWSFTWIAPIGCRQLRQPLPHKSEVKKNELD
jgi:hypothetical protein